MVHSASACVYAVLCVSIMCRVVRVCVVCVHVCVHVCVCSVRACVCACVCACAMVLSMEMGNKRSTACMFP